jgi:hemerythrin-like domain-containing protein
MTHPDDRRTAPHSAPSARTQSPLDLLDSEHQLFVDICNVFERVADGLPDDADLDLARRAADILTIHQAGHYDDETGILFPCLRKKLGGDHVISRTLDQLERHRLQDTDILIELTEVLHFGARGRRPENPDMLGYMLRFYFTSERRQIDWERSIVLPAARMLMSESDLASLYERLSASERFVPSGLEGFKVRHSI